MDMESEIPARMNVDYEVLNENNNERVPSGVQ